jgi:hypothetical protein
MSKKQALEKGIFDVFVRLHPDFAGRPVTTSIGNDPPDILCIDASGKRIGVELGEWLDEIQIAMGKKREGVEKSFTSVIASDQEIPPEHIGISWIGLKKEIPLKAGDAPTFRKEIYELVGESDRDWVRSESSLKSCHGSWGTLPVRSADSPSREDLNP